jgi:hypothetical protein
MSGDLDHSGLPVGDVPDRDLAVIAALPACAAPRYCLFLVGPRYKRKASALLIGVGLVLNNRLPGRHYPIAFLANLPSSSPKSPP